MLRFNANLYRLAFACATKEETRYYLQGVLVEPHAVAGVVLVATDEHRLIAIHDESGSADESAIVKLSPDALKACKLTRGERRDVIIFTGEHKAQVCVTVAAEEEGNVTLTDTPLVLSHDCRVDGIFPDWRRVVPQSPMHLEAAEAFPRFNGNYLSSLCVVACELEKHFDRYARNTNTGQGVVATLASRADSPAVVLFNRVPEAFAVLMPVRAAPKGETAPNAVPAWLNAGPTNKTPAAIAAA